MGKLNIVWSDDAWSDFEWWLDHDKKIVKRIRMLIKSIIRTPYEGIGKPEPLKGEMAGLWSRRINSEHRLIYFVDDDGLKIVAARYHYSK